MPQRRFLKFKQITDAVDEAERLAASGYEQCGNWNLGQMCRHLTMAFNASIDGYTAKVPWLLGHVLGPTAKYVFLTVGRIPSGQPGPPSIMPAATNDDPALLTDLRNAAIRVRDHAGAFDRHPIFGNLSPAQHRKIHMIHAAHHLGFLCPKS